MSLRDLMVQIVAAWPAYHQKVRVNKKDPAFALVEAQLPELLRQYVPDYDMIKVEGSTGAGNITAAPWVALFDRRVTTAATTGFYIVYLFSVDLLSVTLALAFGTTQFEDQFGGPEKAFPRMRAAATRLQGMFDRLIPQHLQRGPIDLGAKPRQKLHYAYQQSAILSYAPYLINALPEEAKLVADLQELVRLYAEIVSDPLEVTVDRLVEAVVDPAAQVRTIEVHDFEPRPPRVRREQKGNKHRTRRYSPESRKVGDAGERAVVLYEQQRLTELGRQDLADRVRWHGQQREFLGWDVTSFDDRGEEFFIEVKSTVGKSMSNLTLTVNEWDAARDPGRRERYYIYIVTNALSDSPTVERMRNPASYVDSGKVACEAIIYELELGTQEPT